VWTHKGDLGTNYVGASKGGDKKGNIRTVSNMLLQKEKRRKGGEG